MVTVRALSSKSPAILVILLGLGAAAPALAQGEDEAFVDHVLRQIVCRYPPDPTATQAPSLQLPRLLEFVAETHRHGTPD